MSLMLRCIDGPLQNATFQVDTCPDLVRCVIAGDGTPDVLNLPEDTPRLDEAVHWYRLDRRSAGHMCGSGGCWTLCELHHEPTVRPLHNVDPVNPGALASDLPPYELARVDDTSLGWTIRHATTGDPLVVDGSPAVGLTRWEARQTLGILGIPYREV